MKPPAGDQPYPPMLSVTTWAPSDQLLPSSCLDDSVSFKTLMLFLLFLNLLAPRTDSYLRGCQAILMAGTGYLCTLSVLCRLELGMRIGGTWGKTAAVTSAPLCSPKDNALYLNLALTPALFQNSCRASFSFASCALSKSSSAASNSPRSLEEISERLPFAISLLSSFLHSAVAHCVGSHVGQGLCPEPVFMGSGFRPGPSVSLTSNLTL